MPFSIAICLRALIKIPYDGCPFDKRKIKLRERLIILPGIFIIENRIRFILVASMDGSKAIFFIITFRFRANIMIHHHAAFSPKSAEGSFPPAKSSFITAWTATSFMKPMNQILTIHFFIVDIGHDTKHLIFFSHHLHGGKRKWELWIFHTGQGGFLLQKLSFGKIPVFRCVFTVAQFIRDKTDFRPSFVCYL